MMPVCDITKLTEQQFIALVRLIKAEIFVTNTFSDLANFMEYNEAKALARNHFGLHQHEDQSGDFYHDNYEGSRDVQNL